MKPSDFLLDDDFDVMCLNGDIPIGDATHQHQAVLLKSMPGSFKQAPAACIGLEQYLLDEDKAAMLRQIRMQFTSDGMFVNSLTADNEGNILIEAKY